MSTDIETSIHMDQSDPSTVEAKQEDTNEIPATIFAKIGQISPNYQRKLCMNQEDSMEEAGRLEHQDNKHAEIATVKQQGENKMTTAFQEEEHEQIVDGSESINSLLFTDVRLKKKLVSCETCGKFFAGSKNLAKHRLIHKNDRRYKCELCGKGFIRSYHLNRHRRIHSNVMDLAESSSSAQHSSDVPGDLNDFSLQNENEDFENIPQFGDMNECENVVVEKRNTGEGTSKDLLNEKIDDNEPVDEDDSQENVKENKEKVTEKFFCEVCDTFFTTLGNLRTHIQTHGIRKHKCDECGKDFNRSYHLKRHKRRHAAEKEPKVLHPCKVCQKTFTLATALLRHVEVHSDDKPHECEVCGSRFSVLDNLTQHLNVHSENRQKFKCDVCNKWFGKKSHFARHEAMHTGEVRFKCDECPKAYYDQSQLTQHKKVHVNDEMSLYRCEVCGKRFMYEHRFILHKNRHLDPEDRSFRCHICNRTFASSYGLSEHSTRHTGEKPYGCGICEKRFSYAASLNQHKRAHSDEKPFMCDRCGKGFKRQPHLTEHERCHTGERPYICETCGKAFTRINHLTKHKRVHSGEKPFQCDICKRWFSRSYNVNQHKQTHYNPDGTLKQVKVHDDSNPDAEKVADTSTS